MTFGMLPSVPPAQVPYAGGFNYFNMPMMGAPNAALGGLLPNASAGLGASPLSAEGALGALGNLGGYGAGAEAGGMLGGAGGAGGAAGGLGALGGLEVPAAVAGGAAAGGGAGGFLGGLMPSMAGAGLRATGGPLALGLGGKYLIDRLPFIPGSANDAGSAKSILGDAAAGAGLGAAAASIIPVLGTGVGAALGGLGGAVYGLFDHGGGSSDVSKAEQQSQRNYNYLSQMLASSGPTGQQAAALLDQQLRMQLHLAADEKGNIKPADRQAAYDGINKTLNSVYTQALQQDTAQRQTQQNMGGFIKAFQQYQASSPFKAQQQQFMQGELQRNAYMQSLAAGLKGSGAQQYAKYLIGQDLNSAYAAQQQQQAQYAMLPYQMAMQMYGNATPQSAIQSQLNSSTTTPSQIAALVNALSNYQQPNAQGASPATAAASSSAAGTSSQADQLAQLAALQPTG